MVHHPGPLSLNSVTGRLRILFSQSHSLKNTKLKSNNTPTNKSCQNTSHGRNTQIMRGTRTFSRCGSSCSRRVSCGTSCCARKGCLSRRCRRTTAVAELVKLRLDNRAESRCRTVGGVAAVYAMISR
jgi:hypothetical protein